MDRDLVEKCLKELGEKFIEGAWKEKSSRLRKMLQELSISAEEQEKDELQRLYQALPDSGKKTEIMLELSTFLSAYYNRTLDFEKKKDN